MRQYILACVMLVLCVSSFADLRVETGNKLYSEGKYQEAIDAYQKIVNTNLVSGDLYFNLANAYYKNGDLVQSIIFFERALLLKPQDADIKYNLELANSQTTDKIEAVGVFFLSQWVNSFRNSASSDVWAYYGVSFFIGLLVFLGFFFFSNTVTLKKLGFFLSIAFVVLMTVSFTFSYHQKQKLVNREFAIVTNSSLTVKSSPSSDGTELFILHEGVKVKVINALGTWRQIEIADGNQGWIDVDSIEVI